MIFSPVSPRTSFFILLQKNSTLWIHTPQSKDDIRSDVYPVPWHFAGGCCSSTLTIVTAKEKWDVKKQNSIFCLDHRPAGMRPSFYKTQASSLTTVGKTDHFPSSIHEAHTNATFSQCNFYDDSYYKPGGPVYLYIGGETNREYRLPNLRRRSKTPQDPIEFNSFSSNNN